MNDSENGTPVDNNEQVQNPLDIVIGRNPVIEAMRAGTEIDKIYFAEGSQGPVISKIKAMARQLHLPYSEIPLNALNDKAKGDKHQGVVAAVAMKKYVEIEDIFTLAEKLDEKPFIIIADEISDPLNLGALIRSADAAGAHGIIISKHHAAGLTPAVKRTAAGAFEHLPIVRASSLANMARDLKRRGVWLYGADVTGKEHYFTQDYKCACAIIVGSEGNGISQLLKKECDFLVSIPMKGKVSCLNASAAGTLLMFEVMRQRMIE